MRYMLSISLLLSQVTQAECLYSKLSDWRQGERSVAGESSKIMVKNLKKENFSDFVKIFAKNTMVQIAEGFWIAEVLSIEDKNCRTVMLNRVSFDKDNSFVIMSSFVDSAKIFKNAFEKISHLNLKAADFAETMNVVYKIGEIDIRVQSMQSLLSREKIISRMQKIMMSDGYVAIDAKEEQSQSISNFSMWYQKDKSQSLRQVTVHSNEQNISEVTVYESTTK